MSASRDVWNARFAMIGVIVCWSGAFTAIKVGLVHVGPFDLVALRFILAAFPLALVLAWTGWPRLDRREWLPFGAVALITVTVYHFALNWGETAVSAGAAALIVATGPMWTALFSALLLKERVTPAKAAGILLALAGVALIVVGGGEDLGVRYAVGALVILLAPVSWAYSTVLSKPLVMRHGAERIAAAATLAGTALVLPVLLTGTVARAQAMPREGWVAVAFLALAATVFGYLGFNYALKRLTPSETTTFVYLNPVFGLAWGFFLLGERPSLLMLAGGAVVLLGIGLANLRPRAAPSPAAPLPTEPPLTLRSDLK